MAQPPERVYEEVDVDDLDDTTDFDPCEGDGS